MSRDSKSSNERELSWISGNFADIMLLKIAHRNMIIGINCLHASLIGRYIYENDGGLRLCSHL